jgi:peptidoglycan hydrolase-like protein with peptidoglycan-binding domain
VDGIFGPKTQNALVTVRKGARGNITYIIQSALYILGYNVIPDKIFGTITESAVRAFQQDNRLIVDGVAGRETQTKLFSSL